MWINFVLKTSVCVCNKLSYAIQFDVVQLVLPEAARSIHHSGQKQVNKLYSHSVSVGVRHRCTL